MKKLLGIVVLGLLWCGSANAWCRDEFGGLFDWSKEHKECGNYARSLNVDEFRSADAYCKCRVRLDNLKRYGVEKLFEHE